MTGWMSERRYCANGHDLTDHRNLYPRLAGRGPDRRCRVCIKIANDTRRAAYVALGMTQADYLATYGASIQTARRVLRDLGVTA